MSYLTDLRFHLCPANQSDPCIHTYTLFWF